jgi:uncharacterized protein DUF1559
MIRTHWLAASALAAGLLSMAGQAPAQNQTQPKVAPMPLLPLPGQPLVAGQPLPGQPVLVGGGELPVVPKSAPMFVSVKVSALVDHPDLRPVLEQLKKAPEGTEGFVEMLGVAPHEIDRITLFWPAMPTQRWFGEPVLVVTTREAYNEARLIKSLRAEPVFVRDWQRDGRRGGGMMKAVPEMKSAPPIIKEEDFPRPPPLDIPKFPSPPKIDPKPPIEEDGCTTTIAAEFVDGPLFYEIERGPFSLVFLVDERTLVFLPNDFGHGNTHLALLAQLMKKQSTGPLTEAIAAASGHTIAAGAHLTPFFRTIDRFLPPELAPYAALLAARTAVITGDMEKTAKFTLTLAFDDAAAARRAGPVLEEGLKAVAAKAAGLTVEMKESHRPQERAVAPLLESVAAGLKKATAKVVGTTVVAAADIEVGPAAGKAAAELLQAMATQKKFAERTNNLKQIGLALHNYHDANGRLPTNIYNAKGEAILSWRVHLLPYLEHDNIYRQMKLDEPWDGPTNKQFIEQMPKVYELPDRKAMKGTTFYQAFVSPDPRKPPPKGANVIAGRAWLVEGEKMGRSLAAIPDGTSNTLAVVEAREAVIWSKPDDLPFGEKLPLLGEERADRFGALMFDGSVRLIPTKIDPATLRALITLDGGEVVPGDLDHPRGGRGEAIPRSAPDHVPVKEASKGPPPPPKR